MSLANCCCTPSGTPCSSSTVCLSFVPACAPAISGGSLTMTYSPDDGSTPATFTGASNFHCLTQSKVPGTLTWSWSSTNYLPDSGSQHITTCSPATISRTVSPNTYKLTAIGCNIGSDGTTITLTASGGISGTCTATGSAGTVSCTIAATAPVTTPVTITIVATRYMTVGSTTWNACGATQNIGAATGYTCCSPLSNCIPIKDSRILHCPLGDFPYSQFAGGSASTFTAIVNVTAAPGPAGLQDCLHPAAGTPVSFLFSVNCAGTSVTVTYNGCNGTFVNCDNNVLGEELQLGYTGSASTGIFCYLLTPACPPGTIGTAGGPQHPHRYAIGGCSIDEN